MSTRIYLRSWQYSSTKKRPTISCWRQHYHNSIKTLHHSMCDSNPYVRLRIRSDAKSSQSLTKKAKSTRTVIQNPGEKSESTRIYAKILWRSAKKSPGKGWRETTTAKQESLGGLNFPRAIPCDTY